MGNDLGYKGIGEGLFNDSVTVRGKEPQVGNGV